MESACQPPLSIILSSGSPCSNRSSAAPTLNEWSLSRGVLTSDIFDILRNQSAGAGREIQLADAINTQAAKNAVEAVTLNGRRFDCSSVQGYLNAIMHVGDCIVR